MALGIDPATTLRLADEKKVFSLFEARGIAPCRTHAPNFIWSNKRVQHQTAYEGVISFEQAWSSYLSENDNIFTYKVEGQELSKSWDAIIAEALQKLIKTTFGKTAIAVDNSFSEDQQSQLLSISSRGYLSNVDLLWRPVAITLDFLDRNSDSNLSEETKLLIVDAESSRPEATILEFRSVDGYLIPLRKFFRKEDALSFSLSTIKASRKLALKLADLNEEKANFLQGGEFLADFACFRNGGQISDTWVKKNHRFEPFSFSKTLAELLEEKNPFGGLVAECRQRAKECDADIILWHGWPMRCRKDLNQKTDYVMSADSVALGAKRYAERVEAGLPSYLELLPELEIYSKNHKTNHLEFFTIIEEKEYPGGRKISIDPINDFDIQKGIKSLPIILRRSDWENVRKVEFDDLPEIEENAPITITGQLLPGQGHLRLRMLSRDKRKNIFGEKRHIDINWDTMEDFDLHEQLQEKCCPDVYPIAGRVFDEDDPEIRQCLRDVVKSGSLDMIVNYHGHSVSFLDILVPWGYHWPWNKGQRGKPTCNQSTRGVFGPSYIKDEEIDQLAKELASIISNKDPKTRHKLLNYMFIYTHESFVQELRNIYSTPVTELPANAINTNTAYAVGRVFHTSADMELFFKFLINSSNDNGWPSHPTDAFTMVYFWSVFRCLCYYEETSRIDSSLATGVCQ
ncbi:MAG: hypothetical protein HQK65_05875, partial [Desulfamplus sp.]|nr:hypothetical protein [Desulfamplus sp.]